MKKVGHTSEFEKHLFKKLLKWANKKQNDFNIYNVAFKKKKKEKHLEIQLSKS